MFSERGALAGSRGLEKSVAARTPRPARGTRALPMRADAVIEDLAVSAYTIPMIFPESDGT